MTLTVLDSRVAERFEAKVDRSGDCHLWTGAKNQWGYGRFLVARRVRQAHRVAMWFATGEEPTEEVVMHLCDNPSCVNPEHLRAGTFKDNTQDMVQKKRNIWCRYSGEASPTAKLSDAQVGDIRAEILRGDRSYEAIGRQFGVTGATVRNIRDGKRKPTVAERGLRNE